MKVRFCENYALKFLINLDLFIFKFSKVSELREALKSKGLNTTGNKQELIDRLNAANSDNGIDPKFEDELLNDVRKISLLNLNRSIIVINLSILG